MSSIAIQPLGRQWSGSRTGIGLRRQLWWIVPLLLLLGLAQLRDHRALQQWILGPAQVAECGQAGPSREQALPRLGYGKACEMFLLQAQLAPGELNDQVLILNGFGRDVRVWMNGVQLRDFDNSALVDHTSIPLRIALAPAILNSGSNELLIQLRSGTGIYDRSYLGRVLLGPASTLDPPLGQMLMLGQQAAQLSIIFALAIALTVLPIAWTRPSESGYRWFALAVLSSQLFVWNMGWPIRPLPHLLWHVVAHGGLVVALWALLRYSLAVTDGSAATKGWVNRLTLLAALALTLRLLSPAGGWLPIVGDSLFRLILLAQLLVLAIYWWRCRGPTQPLARWLAAGAVLNLVIGVVDSLRVYGVYTGGLTPYLQHWGIMYLLITLLVGQIRRILAALTSAEDAQQQLTAALALRTADLSREFDLRQQAEQARTLAEERQRIMRDMHDGVGGQLVALIGQVEAGHADGDSLKPQLRRSLDDLRLMIDSLDDACADLSVALGMLRQRLQPGLRGLPIAVRWNTARLPDLAPCPPDVVLQVLRIVQEAITNAIKHSAASQIEIAAEWSAGELRISIIDDGVGLDRRLKTGRGIPSMQQRAQRIGAELTLRQAGPGTEVLLGLAVAADQGQDQA